MRIILMRVEGHETDIPTAGDAQPLGRPLPRGTPVKKVYSKRLGEAGFKTDDKGNMSYTPGKAVVDAANGYAVKPPSLLEALTRKAIEEMLAEREMLNNLLAADAMYGTFPTKDRPLKVGDRVMRKGWDKSHTISKLTQDGVCFEGYGALEFPIDSADGGPLLHDTAFCVGDRVARPKWAVSYIVTKVLDNGLLSLKDYYTETVEITSDLGTIVHDSSKPLYNP